jgi:hypothetical protein
MRGESSLGVTVETLNQIFRLSAVILPFFLAFVGFGALITGNIINARKDAEIQLLKPRSISEKQKTDLLQGLRNTRGRIGVISRLMDGESADYADQIAAVFAAAQWTIAPPVRSSTNDLPGFVTLTDTNANLVDLGIAVATALNAASIDCRPVQLPTHTIGGGLQPDTLYIVVGRQK